MRMELAKALRYIENAEQHVMHQERLVQSLRQFGQEAAGETYLLEHLRDSLLGCRTHLFDMIVYADLTWAPERDKKVVPRRI